MTISLITCAVSLIALATLAMNKQRDLDGKTAMFRVGSPSTDSYIAATWKSVVYMVTHVSVQSCRRMVQQATINLEGFFIKNFDKLGRKFTVVGDMVTGYDLPKNRGSVSFFLKNIEDHKKTIQRRR